MAAPTFISSSVSATFTSNVITITKPTGLVDNCSLVAFFTVFGTGFTPPSGWTTVATFTGVGSLFSYIAIKQVGTASSEPASYAFTAGTSSVGSGEILAYDSAAVDVYASTSYDATSASFPGPSVTTTGPNRTVLDSLSVRALSGGIVAASGTTDRASTGGSYATRTGEFSQAVAGATAVKTPTTSNICTAISVTVALYIPTTNISLSRIFKWNVKAAVTTSRIFQWNVRSALSLSRIFKWNVRSVVSLSRIFKWNVRTAVAPLTRTFKWNVIGGVIINRTYQWNVRAVFSATRVFKWNVRMAVAPFTRQYKWNVRLGVSTSRVFKWNVLQSISTSRVFKWNVRNILTISRTFKWNVTGRVFITRIFLWAVFRGWQAVPKTTDIWTEIPENPDVWTEIPEQPVSWR